ncbi:MAG TPA: phosphatidylglycerophosphatase A, partial [Burkholderiaceae bacterium]
RFLFAHPAHLIAPGLGSGLLRPAPGTWGTLLAWALFDVAALWWQPGPAVGAAFLVATLLGGTWAAARTGRALGEVDSSAIVIDEIVAFWIVLAMLPQGPQAWRLQVAGFVLFRIFDIAKPPPIAGIDRRWRSARGVMADDLVAAFYTLLVIAVGSRLA